MKVYKFGGASVKDAGAVKNLYQIIKEESEPLVIVVSAMDKTTNALESLHQQAYQGLDFQNDFHLLCGFHRNIIQDLFSNNTPLSSVELLLENLENALNECRRYSEDFTYSQIVSYGELLSTTIISEYLNAQNSMTTLIDARKCIQTDNNWKEGIVNWEFTKTFCKQFILPALKDGHVVTQGFIGAGPDGHTTTLGREGSDFTAAILASSLDAESVTVWKDVPGILTGDPKQFEQVEKIDLLTYRETVEMAYYGASVIHPKTIKPLSEKSIPLLVKSFLNPGKSGTLIQKGDSKENLLPVYILKKNQCLITFANKDLSFTSESSIGEVLHFLSKEQIKINMIQSSATSFSVCIIYNQTHINKILKSLDHLFTIHYNDGLELLTIKNYSDTKNNELNNFKKKLYLEQRTRNNIRILYKRD